MYDLPKLNASVTLQLNTFHALLLSVFCKNVYNSVTRVPTACQHHPENTALQLISRSEHTLIEHSWVSCKMCSVWVLPGPGLGTTTLENTKSFTQGVYKHSPGVCPLRNPWALLFSSSHKHEPLNLKNLEILYGGMFSNPLPSALQHN